MLEFERDVWSAEDEVRLRRRMKRMALLGCMSMAIAASQLPAQTPDSTRAKSELGVVVAASSRRLPPKPIGVGGWLRLAGWRAMSIGVRASAIWQTTPHVTGYLVVEDHPDTSHVSSTVRIGSELRWYATRHLSATLGYGIAKADWVHLPSGDEAREPVLAPFSEYGIALESRHWTVSASFVAWRNFYRGREESTGEIAIRRRLW